jgi:hypothetical protein
MVPCESHDLTLPQSLATCLFICHGREAVMFQMKIPKKIRTSPVTWGSPFVIFTCHQGCRSLFLSVTCVAHIRVIFSEASRQRFRVTVGEFKKWALHPKFSHSLALPAVRRQVTFRALEIPKVLSLARTPTIYQPLSPAPSFVVFERHRDPRSMFKSVTSGYWFVPYCSLQYRCLR